jgi:Icc-related predicted phosphoesterase
MEIEQPPAPSESTRTVVRVAAAGDVHCREDHREQAIASFAALRGQADILLLAGDLTTHGEPAQGAVLADACRQLEIPVFAVLGNHDWHVNRVPELIDVLQDGGITVLERDHAICEVRGVEVGIAGAKGFIGGFPGSHLPDFGEPLLREVYRETQAEVDALHRGLCEIALCPLRLALLHYAPTLETLQGEGEGIMAFLGTDRLAAPLLEHEPTLALHGHAHAGTFQGRVGSVPVCNVSVPVIGRDFHVFELAADSRAAAPIH